MLSRLITLTCSLKTGLLSLSSDSAILKNQSAILKKPIPQLPRSVMIYSSIQSLCQAHDLNPQLLRLAKLQRLNGFNTDGTINWNILKEELITHQSKLDKLLPEFNTRAINQIIKIDNRVRNRMRDNAKANLTRFTHFKPTINLNDLD